MGLLVSQACSLLWQKGVPAARYSLLCLSFPPTSGYWPPALCQLFARCWGSGPEASSCQVRGTGGMRGCAPGRRGRAAELVQAGGRGEAREAA